MKEVIIEGDNDDTMNYLRENDEGVSTRTSLLAQLPPELMRHVYAFMDIPMLGSMAQVHTGTLRYYACENLVWGKLVKRRFEIASTTKRSTAFGGKDWKDAYRSMHLCRRIPKCRSTSRKAIFAKGRQSQQREQQQQGIATREPSAGACDGAGLSIWVGVNHTDNCRTRLLRSAANTENEDNNTDNTSRRYVDFWVCLQNPQSNGPSIQAQVCQSTLQFMGRRGNYYTESCLQERIPTSCGGYRWMAPRWMKKPQQQQTNWRKHCSGKKAWASLPFVEDDSEEDISLGITLKPMEFCVVSIPFECGQDMFETDALARSVRIQVPYVLSSTIESGPTTSASFVRCHQDEYVNGDKMEVDDTTWVSTAKKPPLSLSTAWFVSEHDIWDHYDVLPGGCLTLSDRDRRIHM